MSPREIVGVRMKLASPERVRELSSGEVKKPETINYRTLRPEKDGLFCERIFGPTRSYECACGKYKRSGPKFRGVICDRCGVEVTDNRVRRDRMGHIELAAPVVHIWYLRGIPSRLSLLLGTSNKDLEKVVYFAPTRRREQAFKVVTEGKRADLAKKGSIISDCEERIHRHYDPKFKAEEAYRIVRVEDLPVSVGDVVGGLQLSRLRSDFGEEFFKVEPAYALSVEGSEEQSVISESQLASLREAQGDLHATRLLLGNQDAYVVTAASYLPFAKNDVISESEYRVFNQKYTGRFEAQPETITLEDPCIIVISASESPFAQSDIILERQQDLCHAYDKQFAGGIGAEGIYELLKQLKIEELVGSLREEVADSSGQKKRKLVKRLQVVEDFRKSDSYPMWMVMSVLPVIPPDLRPMVQLDGGRFATSDLNDLYRRVINRNNRLKKLQELRAPEIIVRNEKRMLQESVDALIDNGRRGKAVLGAGNRPLKSLTDLLRGKKGRFRQNLLGKRVDYSGRSVIVIGPSLKIYQCGLPKQMALELFKPFVIHELAERGLAPNVKSARRFIERGRDEVWGILEEIIKDHPVMLNRAPTLHRLGIQAFEPVLIEGKAIRLHPLVCTAFNADFDGDQMAVHVPLSLEAQTEARVLMLSSNNLLSPASGRSVVTPTQDIILGIFCLTCMWDGLKGQGKSFLTAEDVLSALDHGQIHVNARIRLRINPEWVDVPASELDSGKWVETSAGRVVFNSALHPGMRFINRSISKKELSALLDESFDRVGQAAMVEMLDAIKMLGYHWSTISGVSLGIGDVVIPTVKKEMVDKSLGLDSELSAQYEMGILTYDEYIHQKDILWSNAGREISDRIMDEMLERNALRIMVDSGARGSRGQVAQMAGIRGLMADPSGKILDYPITANFREGLNMLEYFLSTHGARKGLADTALRTAKSGYLTRRLVDVAQDLIVTEEDCGTDKGVRVKPLLQEGKVVISLSERLFGRVALSDIHHPKTGELLVHATEEIPQEVGVILEECGIDSVWVRSPLTCGLYHGVCRTCYGRDLATRQKVAIGEAVGVVAAQSIGEPGTQLTMRTFHTGGVRQFSGEDITQGLPRIEQLFEVRRPKKVAILAERDGVIAEIRSTDGKKKIILSCTTPDGGEERVPYGIPASQDLLMGIEVGAKLKKGQLLTEGYLDPQQLLEVEGLEAVQHYLLNGIQEVYRSQGVTINDKHVETILRKVAPVNRVRILEEGDSAFVSGELVWLSDFENTLQEIQDYNTRCQLESTTFLTGKTVREIAGQGSSDLSGQLRGVTLTEPTIAQILTPGISVTDVYVHDEGKALRVLVGETSFRRLLDGLQLIDAYEVNGETLIPAGAELTSGHITTILRNAPQPVLVRDVVTLKALKDAHYLAEALYAGDEMLAAKDSLITDELVERIFEANISSIKVWKMPERVSVSDAMHLTLIERHFGKTLRQAIDKDGNSLMDLPNIMDGSVVRGLVEGNIIAVDVDGEQISREKMLHQVLSEKVYGKVLLETVYDARGNIVAKIGDEIKDRVIENLVQYCPDQLVVRSVLSPSEQLQLVQRVAFVRRLKEEPQHRPVVHGVTKAALATDSFLSAASFQQTAQVLAAAAVRGDVDELRGLKENVIIGLLIPAGTGIERQSKVVVSEKTALPK